MRTSILALVMLVQLIGGVAFAESYWNNNTGGDWSVPVYWINGEPGSTTDAYIGRAGFGLATGSATVTQSGERCRYLTIGYGYLDNGTLNINSGSLAASTVEIGCDGTGTVWHSGGSFTVSQNLLINTEGFSSARGTYNLSGPSGTLLSTGSTYVGAASEGRNALFNQTGGTHSLSSTLWIGSGNGNATYNLDGGFLSAPYVRMTQKTSVLSINGGTASVGNLFLAGSGGTPELRLIEGELSTGSTWLGDLVQYSTNGPASFIQSGGLHDPGVLYVGEGGVCDYQLLDGTLTPFSMYIGGRYTSGTGSFVQSGGTNSLSMLHMGELAGGSGSYELSGGTLTVAQLLLGSTADFDFLGGRLVWGVSGDGARDLSALDAIGIDYSEWREDLPLGVISYDALTGQTTFGGILATPEPSTFSLCMIAAGLGAFASRRRRRRPAKKFLV